MNAMEVQVMVNASIAEETLTMSLEPNVGVQYEAPSHSWISSGRNFADRELCSDRGGGHRAGSR